MTLQQPEKIGKSRSPGIKIPILCHKCGAPIVFDKGHVAPSGRKIPHQPNTSEPHIKYCMYKDLKWNRHTESLFIDFLSKVPRKKRVIGTVVRAK